MAAGTSFAEAYDIGDFEASPYESNSWWDTQPQQYDDFGWWYKPLYWKWVPEHDGWYSVDCLNSNFTDDGNWLPNAFYVQVMYEGGGTVEQDWDQVAAKVEAGQTYYVIITCRYSNTAQYSARISAVAPWSDWVDPAPVTFENVSGLDLMQFQQGYTITQAFGGDLPGHDVNAWSCCWHWSRVGSYGSQYWSPDFNGTVGGDGVTGWGGADGVCKAPGDMPVRSPVNPKGDRLGWGIAVDDGAFMLPAKMRMSTYGVVWAIDTPAAKSNASLVPWPPDAIDEEFEGALPGDPADVTAMQVVLTDTPTEATRSNVLPYYPQWGKPLPPGYTYPEWGVGSYADVDGHHPRVFGSFFGPNELGGGAWPDYAEGETFDVDMTQFAQSKSYAAIYGGLDPGEQYGWLLYVMPHVAFSDSLPPGVTSGVSPQSVSQSVVGHAQLNATYKPKRARFVIAPQPPDLQPPALGAPPCHIYPRDDDLGVGTAAIWPPPSSQQATDMPGAYY